MVKTNANELSLIPISDYRLDARFDLAFHLFIGGFLLICNILPFPSISAFSLVLFCAYYVYLLVSNLKFVLKYLFFVFSIAINVFGVAVCEFASLHLNELATSTAFSGSLPLLILARWLFLAILFLLDVRFGDDLLTERESFSYSVRSKWIPLATLVTTVVLAIALIDVMRYPPAFFAGVDRFSWESTYGNRFLPDKVASNLIYLLIIPALSVRYGNRKLGILAIALFITYSFWTGVKFGGYFELICIFVLVYYDLILKADARRLQSAAIGLFTVMVLLVGGAAYLNSLSSSNESTTTGYLLNRLAQQGQLWWKTFDQCDQVHAEEFNNEIDIILHGDPTEASNHVGSKQGLYMIMYYTAPRNIVNSKLASGSSYTEAGYASAYYYFGEFGVMVFSSVLAVVIWIAVTCFLKALNAARLIDAVVILRIVFVAGTFLSMFWLGLFKPVSIACYAYLLFSYLYRYEEGYRPIAHSPSNHSHGISRGRSSPRSLIV